MLSYAVYARERQLLRIRTIRFEKPLFEEESQLQEWARDDEWMKLDYEQIHVLWNDPRFTVVPKEFASSNHASTLSKFQFDTQMQELLRYSDCGELQLLYVANEKVYYATRSRWAEARHEHIAGRILNWFMDPNIDQDPLIVDHGDYIQMLHREGTKLQFCQSFPYSSINEAAYFILNSMEKLSIKREQVTIRTIGVDPEAKLQELLETYVRQVKQIKLPLPEALKNEYSLHPLLVSLL